MALLSINLDDLANQVNGERGLGLKFRGQHGDMALWEVGNCLMVAHAISRDHSSMHLERATLHVSPEGAISEEADRVANGAWNHLGALWNKAAIAVWEDGQEWPLVTDEALSPAGPPIRTATQAADDYIRSQQRRLDQSLPEVDLHFAKSVSAFDVTLSYFVEDYFGLYGDQRPPFRGVTYGKSFGGWHIGAGDEHLICGEAAPLGDNEMRLRAWRMRADNPVEVAVINEAFEALLQHLQQWMGVDLGGVAAIKPVQQLLSDSSELRRQNSVEPPKGKSGAPRIPDLVARLAKAQEAIEEKAQAKLTWKGAIEAVGWHWGGSMQSKVKLLEDARERLNVLMSHDPEGVLLAVAAYREEKKKTP